MNKINFNDNWTCNGKKVTLPHDAMIHAQRKADAPGGVSQAFFLGDKYVYEKTFTKPKDDHVIVEFEGVHKDAVVKLNGKEIGSHEYGYTPFSVCLDEDLKSGENIITVECDNTNQPDSRWYSGGGIYRPVWLYTGKGKCIKPEAVKIETLEVNPAKIHVSVDCEEETNIEIFDGDKLVGEAKGNDVVLDIEAAKLWSDQTPHLYTCKVSSKDDEVSTNFGIRKVTYDNKGLYVNGESVLLKGGCLHHDNGILGACAYDEAEWRRIKILKDAGFNAIRSAHNPCSRAMLEACDFYGMYLIDEAWDTWFYHKSKYDYGSVWNKNYLSDLKTIVDRDYNHPCVIMYSIGNEVSEPAKQEGIDKLNEMVSYLHELDSSRPVTGGFNLMIIVSSKNGKGIYDEKEGGKKSDSDDEKMNGMNSTLFNLITSVVGSGMNKSANSKKADEITTPALDGLDIAGYNYASGRYPLEGKAHPNRLIYGSETFPYDIAKNWKMVKEYPYLVGDFMWSAWDYIGEVGIGAWAYSKDGVGFNKPYPWLLADTGAFDIVGTPNGEAFLAQTVWGTSKKPIIGVQPINHERKVVKATWRGSNSIESWSWKNCDGKKATIEVYSDADIIELIVNGKSLGKKKVKDCRATFKAKYQSGKIEAVAYDAMGREVSRNYLESATGSSTISVVPEKEVARENEVVFVDINVVGENGVVEANDDKKLTVDVEGGQLLGFGSANPRTEENFDEGRYTTYYGRSLAAIKVKDKKVKINVSDGSNNYSSTIEVK